MRVMLTPLIFCCGSVTKLSLMAYQTVKNKREPTFTGPLQVWPMVYILYQGPMITVEADVTKTLNEKILPRQQELIPVALKRKLSYKGTVMEEMVSKNKVQAYFDYFKQCNPLFGDEILDMERIDNWIEELRSTQEHENHDNNIDPMQEKIDEGRTNIPMETAYNMSDVEKFVGFENGRGENNCWINCVLPM